MIQLGKGHKATTHETTPGQARLEHCTKRVARVSQQLSADFGKGRVWSLANLHGQVRAKEASYLRSLLLLLCAERAGQQGLGAAQT